MNGTSLKDEIALSKLILSLSKCMPTFKSCLLLGILSTVLLIILQVYSDAILLSLRYESTLFINNEYWRLLSGHLVHLSWAHLFLNLLGLWTLLFIFHDIMKPTSLLISILFISIGISLGLYFFSPELDWYVGLSGVLHGLITFCILASYRTNKRSFQILLILIVIKLLWEQLFADPHAMKATIGGQVIYDAHLYGAISGVVFAAALFLVPLIFHHVCIKN